MIQRNGSTPTPRFTFSLLACILLFGACSDAPLRNKDSSRLSENHDRQYVIGAEAYNEFFGAPLVSQLLPDGGAILADSKELVVRMVNSDGVELWRTGGLGQGPSAFLDISDLLLDASGRTLVVDWTTSRLTRFDSAGGFQDAKTLPRISGRNVRVLGIRESGTLTAIARTITETEGKLASIRPDSLTIYQLEEGDSEWKAVGSVLLGDALWVNDLGIQRVMPMTRGTMFAQLCGSAVRVYGGQGIVEIDSVGRVTSEPEPKSLRIAEEEPRSNLSEAFLASLKDRKVRQEASEVWRSHRRAIARVMRLAIPDRDGRMWVRSTMASARGEYELWDGETRLASFKLSVPRFFVDADKGRLLAIVPESDSSSSRAEVIKVDIGNGSLNPQRPSPRCSRALPIFTD